MSSYGVYIYFDSPIVRALSDKPEVWNALYDTFVQTFGRRFQPIKSYYLFFEYIGFTKTCLEIPVFFREPHFRPVKKLCNLTSPNLSQETVELLDRNLVEIEMGIYVYTKQKLFTLKKHIENLVEERMKRVSSFESVSDLVGCLFGDIFQLISNDFEKFAEYAATYLAWDIFCTIRPKGLNLAAVRQKQLGFWLDHRQDGKELPFGKIIDDHAHHFVMSFSSHYKEFEDMVDAELHTYLVLGYELNGQTHPVRGLTYPPKDPNALSKRNELALGAVNVIEQTLETKLEKFPGKLYLINEETHELKDIYEPMFVIPLGTGI